MKHRLIILAVFGVLFVPSSAHAAHLCGPVLGTTTIACGDMNDLVAWNGSVSSAEGILSTAERDASWQETGGIGTASAGTSCRYVRNEREAKSIVGVHLATTKLNRYFCTNGRNITRAPNASLHCQITDAGSWLGWTGCNVTGKVSYCVYWNGYSCGAHYKEATWQIRRCLPSPWGCIQISQKEITRWTFVYSDRHALKG